MDMDYDKRVVYAAFREARLRGESTDPWDVDPVAEEARLEAKRVEAPRLARAHDLRAQRANDRAHPWRHRAMIAFVVGQPLWLFAAIVVVDKVVGALR